MIKEYGNGWIVISVSASAAEAHIGNSKDAHTDGTYEDRVIDGGFTAGDCDARNANG